MKKQVLFFAFAHIIINNSVSAYSIVEVTHSPSGMISSVDPVILEVLIGTPTAPAILYQSTEIIIVGHEILINIFIDSYNLQVPDTLIESVFLGTFPPGTYEYEIVLHPKIDCCPDTRTATGNFVVIAVDCDVAPDIGPCDGVCPRYFFNSETNQCEEFVYGCCEGNTNNFTSLALCEATCGVTSEPSIPAVSDWGLITMTLLILCAGSIVLRRSSAGAL